MLLVTAFVAVSQVQARTYVVVGNGGKLPAKLDAAIKSAGGSVVRSLPQIGVVIVESSSAGFGANLGKVAGLDAVLPDARITPALPVVGASVEVSDGTVSPANHTTLVMDSFAALQWNLDAVDAGTAWQAGQLGTGVRVAVLDSGLAAAHVDLAPNVNTALCTSFVPGEAYNMTGSAFNHGTHVAGIIAAAANGVGTVGVAPKAEIVSVKVLSALTGSGSFASILSGVVYAADIDAKVINMSLGAEFPRTGFVDDNGTPDDASDDYWVGANEVTALINAISRATTYAYQKGVTVVVSAGNSSIDRDHDGSYAVVPADCAHVITVSATGPTGWSLDPDTDLDVPAGYSNHGQSRIDLAAPGGGDLYPFDDISVVAGIARPTWVFDLVFAPSNYVAGLNRYSWAAGTSMAAPHVSAIAAIIIGRNGGKMKPSAVLQALRASADDLGKPGNDDAYGAGRVNAGRAATQ